MPRNRIHVVNEQGQWGLKRENTKSMESTYETKEKALEAGRTLAKKEEAELVIHDANGTIRDSDSYGNDPRSSKDKVH